MNAQCASFLDQLLINFRGFYFFECRITHATAKISTYTVCLFINFRVDSLGCAAELLVNAWNSSLLADKGMFGSMVLVALPEEIGGLPAPQEGSGARQEGFSGISYEDAEVVQNNLYHEFKIEVGIHNGQL